MLYHLFFQQCYYCTS